jgi:hypothetical protein
MRSKRPSEEAPCGYIVPRHGYLLSAIPGRSADVLASCSESRSGTSFADARQDAIHELIVEKHAGSNQLLKDRSSALDLPILLRTQDDAERSDDRHAVGDGAAPGSPVVEHGPSRTTDAVSDDLRLAEPKIPMLDARYDCDVLNSVPLCPLQGRSGHPVLVLTGAHLVDDGVRDQNCGSETLDQVEPVDAREQDEW